MARLSVFVVFLLPVALAATDAEKRLRQKGLIDSLRSRVVNRETEGMTDEQIVQYVNEKQGFWKAEQQRFSGYSEHTRHGMMGVENINLPAKARRNLSETRHLNISIPESFDSREWWPECKSIGLVRDQSSCGSCWAFGAAEAITDRICIASKGEIKETISADDLLACCHSCGEGCHGGYPIKAWDYWVEEGLVTGGAFGDNDTCLPYPFPSCKHGGQNDSTFDVCKHGMFNTPQCSKKCQDKYSKSFKEDKHFGLTSYGVADNAEAIQKELMTYGPVEVAFEVYTDFFHYKSGVYMHTAGPLAGGHAVKLIGWGVEKDVPYWLLVNSWNEEWGDEGFFKILRGTDECGIESGVVGGIPKTK